MAQFTHGDVSVQIADAITPPEKAGKLSEREVKQLARPLPGLGGACEQAAKAIEEAGTAYQLPPNITPDSLRQAGQKVSDIETPIRQAEYVLMVLKQAKLLYAAEALRQLGEVNDQAQAQGKRRPQLLTLFLAVIEFYARPRKKKTPTTPEAQTSEPKPASKS